MEEGTVVPQIDATHGTLDNSQPAAVAALTGDNATDLANIAREMGVSLDASGNVAKEARAQQMPVTPPPVPAPAAVVPAPVEVPPKFQNPDGTVNEAKVEKSTVDVLKGIEYYKAKEKEFHQLQNKVNNPAPQPQQVQPHGAAQLSQLEISMAQDLINEHAAQGVTLDQRSAIAQARVMARGLEAKHAAELSITDSLRRDMAETRMTSELKDLIDADETLLTPAVADRVLAIRQEKGGSYRDAYIQHLGEESIRQRTGQVKTPIPTGQAAKAPPTPVGPVSRVQSTVDLSKPQALSDADLEAAVRAAHPRYRGLNR